MYHKVILARLEAKLLRAKWLIGILVAIVGLLFSIIYVQAENNNHLVYDLNVSQTAFNISKANAKKIYARNVELETANSCLLKAMDKETSVKAIKSTPLPNMIKG